MIAAVRPFAAPVVLLALTAAFLAVSYGYPAESRAMPVLVGFTMAALLLLDILSRTATPAGRAVLRWLNPGVPAAVADPRPPWPVLSIAGFGVAFALLGAAVAVPVYVAGAVWLHGRHAPAVAAAAAAGTALFVFGLFSVLLKLPLFPGLLFGGDF